MFKLRTHKKLFKRANAWEFTNEHNTESITMFANGAVIIRYFARYERFESIEDLMKVLKNNKRLKNVKLPPF